MRKTRLPSGEEIPVLGQGTRHMGEVLQRRADEIAALRLGLNLDMTLIDTSEMYGDGAAEELVSEAIAGRRDEVFLVSKVLPHHATRRATVAACERSLLRLGTDRIDLYLLHWRGSVPLEETVDGFRALTRDGKIRYWGVSNFDVLDMEELMSVSGGSGVATDQVLYNLTRRGIEYDLLPWCDERNVPVMAYSPFQQGRLIEHPEVQRIASRHRVSAAQLALAWVLRKERIVAIPKAGTPAHVQENRAALDIRLTDDDVTALDYAFPPPAEPRPLEMI